ncbi:MAG: hypothetical protein DRJ10_06330 [Bacteroidetes bacterium]|nr:MAG: hypothetical protein DRJ10_06330 [Bacteroidota bacterium]
MNIQKSVLSFLLIGIVSVSVFAQNKKTKKADASFDAGEYFKASEMYVKVYSKASTKIFKAELAFKLGECYRHMNIPRKAEKWYKKAVRYKYQDPMSVLYLAEAMKMNEKYAEAKEQYERYKDLIPDDRRGKKGIESCDLALEWLDKPERFVVTNVKSMNSKQSDYRPEYFDGNTIVYLTSTREGGKGDEFNNNSGQYFSDIFMTMKDRKGEWSHPVPIKGPVNTEFDDGACSINTEATEMYYTSCKVIKNETVGCQIYRAENSGGIWSTPELLSLVPDSSISVGHPAISDDERTLYFVAEMEGGQGGKDIWKVERNSKSGTWGKPKNLGKKVNTANDEMYPYVRENGEFYFASSGHIGIGGLDIFKMFEEEDGNVIVENMKSPINSPSDDFAIIFDGVKDKGYFSSTRPGGRGNDDIYSFYLPPLVYTLQGTVKNESTENPIPEAKVKLVGSDGTSLETNSGPQGKFKFKLKPETDYIVTTQKVNYLKGKAKESTKGLTKSQDIFTDIFMSPIDIVIEIENIFYDLNKADLRPESTVALDNLVEILNDNNTITIELSAHTDFRGSNPDNIDLSQRRAQSVVDYLIKKSIKAERLTAKGYGEEKPKVVTKKLAAKYAFLKERDILNEDFINHLSSSEKKEIAHQINRRTEFKVLRTDFNESGIQFGE